MLHILDVPQFTGVRIHAGNRPEDTEGCPVVGKAIDHETKNLVRSMDALKDLTMKILLALLNRDSVWLEII